MYGYNVQYAGEHCALLQNTENIFNGDDDRSLPKNSYGVLSVHWTDMFATVKEMNVLIQCLISKEN